MSTTLSCIDSSISLEGTGVIVRTYAALLQSSGALSGSFITVVLLPGKYFAHDAGSYSFLRLEGQKEAFLKQDPSLRRARTTHHRLVSQILRGRLIPVITDPTDRMGMNDRILAATKT